MRIKVIPLSPRQKTVLALLSLAAAAVHLASAGYASWNAGGAGTYVILLWALLISRERVEDERVRELKLRAVMAGFSVGFLAAIASKHYFRYRAGPMHSISAYDFMFVMLVTATVMFYYWRWQDGREAGGT